MAKTSPPSDNRRPKPKMKIGSTKPRHPSNMHLCLRKIRNPRRCLTTTTTTCPERRRKIARHNARVLLKYTVTSTCSTLLLSGVVPLPLPWPMGSTLAVRGGSPVQIILGLERTLRNALTLPQPTGGWSSPASQPMRLVRERAGKRAPQSSGWRVASVEENPVGGSGNWFYGARQPFVNVPRGVGVPNLQNFA